MVDGRQTKSGWAAARTLGAALAGFAMLAARPAAADEGELQFLLAPSVALVEQSGAWHNGASVGFATRYGVPSRDWLAVELDVHWSRFADVSRPVGARGRVVYDARRVGTSIGLLLRHGGRLNASAGGGLGYRYDSYQEKAAALLTGGNSLPSRHRLVAVASASLEWRFVDRFSASLHAAWDAPGIDGAAELRAGIALAVYAWPNLSD